MPRSTAIATLLLLLLPLCLPLVPPKGESSLPACCGRDGKHRCSVSSRSRAAVQDHAAPAVQTAGEFCPYRSLPFVPAASNAISLPAQRVSAVRPPEYPEAVLQTVMRARVAEARNHHKRGPPYLLA